MSAHPAGTSSDPPATEGTIADALVLCMTRGMSLSAWQSSGSIEREWAIYAKLAPRYGRIVVASYATDARERVAAKDRGAEVVFNEGGLAPEVYARTLPERVTRALTDAGARTCLVKTNQFEGGAEAVAITRCLRAARVDTALVARGGYPWSRFEAWKHGPDSEQAARAAAEEGDLCRNADLVVGTTDSMVDDLSWRYAIARSRFALIPNYVLTGSPATTQAASTADRPVILTVGRLEPQKRPDMLVRAVANSGAADRAIVRIIGQGPMRDALINLAEREGVNLRIDPPMPHAHVLEAMAACTLFVQCSAFEGHPKAVLEAMSVGACVLVTGSPGLAEVARDGRNARVSPDDERALGELIAHLLADEPARRRLGHTARTDTLAACALDAVLEKELRAHAAAINHARRAGHAARPIGAVRWDPILLPAPLTEQVACWRDSLSGFARRLPPRDRARFLLALDDPIYQLQGPAAIAVETEQGGSGIHPKHRLMRYHDFFVERISKGESAVDLGSGVGALAASVAERCAATVVGVEISEPNIEKARAIARERGLEARLHYVMGDITTHRAAAPDGSPHFDAVILSNVLEHLKHRPAMLRRWAEWYTPARFLIRVPAFDRDWKVPFKQELGVEWRLDDTHELEYTEDALRTELRDAGLLIDELVTRWGEYWLSARPCPRVQDWARIRMLVFDFDGVMSNNQVLVMQDGAEGVLCNRSDGLGIETLRKAAAARTPPFDPPFSMLVLSKEVNPVVAARSRKLKLECHQGVDDKLPALQRLAADRGVARDQIAYVGNDVNDLACMRWVGMPVAVADAFPPCKAAARFITQAPGGHGAVREVCDRLLATWAASGSS